MEYTIIEIDVSMLNQHGRRTIALTLSKWCNTQGWKFEKDYTWNIWREKTLQFRFNNPKHATWFSLNTGNLHDNN